jgi:hypothetical protein
MAGTVKPTCKTCLVWRVGLVIAILALVAVWLAGTVLIGQ